MKRLIILLLLMFSLPSVAQRKPSAEQPATRDDILRMLDATGIRQQYERMQAAMLQQTKTLFPVPENEHLTSGQRSKLQEINSRMMAEIMRAYTVSDAIDDIAPLYQKHFTKSDVSAIIAFYVSPAGQKFIQTNPEIMTEYMAAAIPKLRERTQPIVEKYQKELEEVMKTSKPSPDSGPNK